MPRGGHPRSGPTAFDPATREVRGTRTRAHHQKKGLTGATTAICEGPPHLTEAERAQWDYYAPLLIASERLTLEARDTLAKYCTALATVARLKQQMGAEEYRDILLSVTIDGAGTEHVSAKPNPLLTQLRQWVLVCRGYETDLLLSPAAGIRVPKSSGADAPVNPLLAMVSRRNAGG